MNYPTPSYLLILLIALLIAGCGPSEEEQRQREQARQDSLEQARQDSLQKVRQQRQDSLEQARKDSARKQSNQPEVTFTESGPFAVQVASWRSRWKAEKKAQMWKERGYKQAYVVQYGNQETGNVWFRVRLGHVESRDVAQQLRENLKQEYNSQSWIASVN